MTLEEFASHFDKAKRVRSGYYVCCPVHDDKSPSATLTEKEGKILGHCFSCGANGLQMARAVGVSPMALFSEAMEVDGNYLLKKTQESDDFLIYSIDQARQRGERVSYQDGKAYRQAMARRERRTELNIKQVIL
jgi:hypothetical protein